MGVCTVMDAVVFIPGNFTVTLGDVHVLEMIVPDAACPIRYWLMRSYGWYGDSWKRIFVCESGVDWWRQDGSINESSITMPWKTEGEEYCGDKGSISGMREWGCGDASIPPLSILRPEKTSGSRSGVMAEGQEAVPGREKIQRKHLPIIIYYGCTVGLWSWNCWELMPYLNLLLAAADSINRVA